MKSLQGRLLLTGLVVLLAFVGFTALALERAFRSSAEQGQEDKMKGLVYALLGATEVNATGQVRIEALTRVDERLLQSSSGLTATILDRHGRPRWQSPSLLGESQGPGRPLRAGEWLFGDRAHAGDAAPFTLAFGVDWTGEDGVLWPLTVVVTEDAAAFDRQLFTYRRSLWGWMSLAVLLLLALQIAVLRWGLLPLGRLTRELRDIEAGRKHQIDGAYPTELQHLTEDVNSLLHHERGQQVRYRHALGDLAHSLKTPVAALHMLKDHAEIPDESRRRFAEQLSRIDDIVNYQLRKAATVGRRAFTQPLPVEPLIKRIVTALAKVYHDKRVEYHIDVDPGTEIRGDEGDVVEVLGNLLDNASKWCRKRVRIGAVSRDNRTLDLFVDDDGPGFPSDHVNGILRRGVRADSRISGQGIGLAVVNELVTVYGGTIALSASPLGGARVHVTLP
jgi:two-component system sensor histidine kinase PhoQ